MSFASRRMAFQLTPLLDLLLIVIFAQYLDVKRDTEEAAKQTSKQLQDAKDESKQLSDRAENVESKLLELQKDKAAEIEKLKTQLAQMQATQSRLADSVKQLFQIPDKLVDSVVKSNPNLSPKDRERLKQEFKKLANQKTAATIKHIVAHDEIKKRVDIWEVKLSTAGGVELRTRLNDPGKPAGTFDFYNLIDEERAVKNRMGRQYVMQAGTTFADRLFANYKSLPQPKSIVIILFSFDPQKIGSQGMLEAAKMGLRDAAEKMNRDAGNRTKFEYAILGISHDQ